MRLLRVAGASSQRIFPSGITIRRSYHLKFKILTGFAVIILLIAGYFWLALSWSYSTGARAGWVQKLSKKGWLCKTWEGELAMVAMPGTLSEKFYFTVRDEQAVEKINRSMGKRIALHYEQKAGLPTSCFGDTRYYVTNVVEVEETPPVPGNRAP